MTDLTPVGIKPPKMTPVWTDLEGPVFTRETGAGRPAFSVFRSPIKGWSFVAGDSCDQVYHWPHGHIPGSDIFMHCHWSHTGTSISGSLVLTYNWTFAKGHNQEIWGAPTAFVQTISTPNITARPQYGHFLDEAQFSASSPTGGQIDTEALEIDGIFKMQIVATTIPTLGGGGALFLDYFDMHILVDCIGTIDRRPDFDVAP